MTPRGFLCCPLWAGPLRRWGWGGPSRASSCPRTRSPWCWCYRSPRAIPSATGGAPGPRHLFWPVNGLRILFTKRNFCIHACADPEVWVFFYHTRMHGSKNKIPQEGMVRGIILFAEKGVVFTRPIFGNIFTI